MTMIQQMKRAMTTDDTLRGLLFEAELWRGLAATENAPDELIAEAKRNAESAYTRAVAHFNANHANRA